MQSAADKIGRQLGYLIGDSRRRLSPTEVDNVRRNLIEFGLAGGGDPAEVEQLVQATFHSFGLFVAEFMLGLNRSPARIRTDWELEGFAHLDRLNTNRRGWILTGAHTGNWEQLGALGPLLGRRLVAPTGVQFHRILSPLVKRLKRRWQIESVAVENSPRRLLRAIEEGALVALPLDGGSYRRGRTVPLNGGAWQMATGAAALSVRSGVPVVPVFSKRLHFMSQQVTVTAPIYPVSPRSGDSVVTSANISAATSAGHCTADSDDAVALMLRELSARLGRHLQSCRDQWCIFRPLGASGDSGCGV